ncbi:hypothetical protein P175DRAFT_0521865, partial [Aspergillus ochraceoroseus IBT 24754]
MASFLVAVFPVVYTPRFLCPRPLRFSSTILSSHLVPIPILYICFTALFAVLQAISAYTVAVLSIPPILDPVSLVFCYFGFLLPLLVLLCFCAFRRTTAPLCSVCCFVEFGFSCYSYLSLSPVKQGEKKNIKNIKHYKKFLSSLPVVHWFFGFVTAFFWST